jgi:16S rRNA (adenine1518-N6/adenine1519-N6)-dimethyltransferase
MIDPTSPKQASELLRTHGIRAQKRLGQNFLCDRNTLDKIVRAANLTPDDRVVEIGPGLGGLTLALSRVAFSVTAVEIDRHLEPILTETLADVPNVQVVYADFLKLDLNALFETAFGEHHGVVVANIPYYITSPLLEILLDNKKFIKRIVLLVQNEFAQRAVAKAGSDACGSMSLYVQYHARAEICGVVPPTVFLPSPEVTSAILALDPVLPGTIAVENEDRMFHLIRSAFGQRRKTLLNALMRAPASYDLGFTVNDRERAEALLARAGIDGNRRGETLTLEEFARISAAFEPR